MFKLIAKYLKRYKGELIVFTTMLFMSISASFLIPKILGEYIDSFAKGTTINKYIIYLFITVVLIESISAYFTKYLRTKISNRITLDIIKDLTSHILKLPISFFRTKDVMYLSSRVNGDSFNLADFSTRVISEVVVSLISLLVSYVYIFAIDFNIGFRLVLLIPLYITIYKLLEKSLFDRSFKQKEGINKAMAVMNNQYLNIKYTKINNWYRAFEENLKIKTDEAQSTFEKYAKILFAFNGIDTLIKRLGILVLIAYSGSLVLRDMLTIGEFTIIIAYFNISFNSLTGLIEFSKFYQDAKVSYFRVKELLETTHEKNGEAIMDGVDEITLKNLTFGYDKGPKLLNGLNYTFNKGKVYCIKGKNGAGKSTLLELITGIDSCYEGDIFYNKENLRNINLYKLRSKVIGYVEQNPNIVEGNLLYNLTLGVEMEKINYIKEVCEKLSVDKILPKGYEDNITPNNVNLSGGEKQKIIIARALGKDGDIIIMDEPTSALDLKSKEKLKTMLSNIKKDKIIILITHDNSLEDICDEILSLV